MRCTPWLLLPLAACGGGAAEAGPPPPAEHQSIVRTAVERLLGER